MPARHHGRPLKAWRWVGVFDEHLMICGCLVRVGPARRWSWALWDREHGRLREGAGGGRPQVELPPGRLLIAAPELRVELALEEGPGVETVCPDGRAYAWTRKQGGVTVRGVVEREGVGNPLEARAVIDDSAGYHRRHTRWRWSAGVGADPAGRELAWNLVSGVNDPPQDSERTVWVDGVASEAPPARFAPDLGEVDELHFALEAKRVERQNALLVRSTLRQPFGSFSGRLPGGIPLARGLGVMEDHDVWW